MRINLEFDLADYLHSNTADKYGIKEQYYPDIIVKRNLAYLHSRLIVPILEKLPYGYWLNLTCGYRCPAVNTKVKGAKNSEHISGMAADIECYDADGKECNDVILLIFQNYDLEFTQVISEKGTKDRPNWVHVSYNINNLKKQVLRID